MTGRKNAGRPLDALFCSTALAFVLAAVATPAQAQIDEIVVTAQKRSESAQRVPLAITALDEETLTEVGFDGFEDLSRITPGLQLGTFGPWAFVNLRGIGQENNTAGGDPGVALHYDGIYIGRPVGFLFSAFDSERVEILRGPQGTLYGRNATGGSINYITKKPTAELGGTADITLGTYDMVRGRAAVNLPLADGIATRLVGFFEQRDGFTKNLAGPDANDADNWGVRSHIEFDRNGPMTLLLSGAYIKSDGVGSKPESREPYPGTTTTPNVNLAGPPGFAFSGGPSSGIPGFNNYLGFGPAPVNDLRPFKDSNDTNLEHSQEFLLLSATLEYDLGPVSFRSLTGYGESYYKTRQDEDYSPLPLSEVLFSEDAQQFSQEIQLLSNKSTPLQWILGAYYFEEEAFRITEFFKGRFDVFARLFNQPSGWWYSGDINSRSYAFFAQATYKVLPSLSLTGGLRYSNDRKKGVNRGFQFSGQPFSGPVRGQWDKITYRAVLDYQVSDDSLAYVSHSTGYRSGGINQAINPLVGNAIYEPESVRAWEAGFKSMLFDRRVRVNAAAYHNKYSNLQFQVLQLNGPIAYNAPGAKVKGIEVEALAEILMGLSVNTAVSYTDGKLDDAFIQGTQLGGNRVAKTPEWTFNIGVTQEIDLGDAGVIKLRGDYAYVGSSFTTPFNRRAGFAAPGGSDFVPSHQNLDLRLFWSQPIGLSGLEVEFAATNVFDTAQIANLTRDVGFNDIPGGGGGELVTYKPPRQFTIRVGMEF